MKWKLESECLPEDDTEFLGIFDSDPSDVWYAIRNGEKFYGATRLLEKHQIHGKLICWRPCPKSPFDSNFK